MKWWGGILALVITGSSFADVLTLQKAVVIAKDYSPDVRALKKQAESARAKAALALAPTEPTLSISYNDMQHSFNFGSQASTVYQITQPVAFPGKAFVNHAALARSADALESQMKAMSLQVVTNTKTAYWQLYQAAQNIILNEEQKRSYERILDIAKRRYETGTIPQVDLLNAQVTLYSNENDESDLKAAEKSAAAALNILLGRPEATAISLDTSEKFPKCPKLTFERAEQKMLANRNELKAATEQLDSAENAYTLAKMSLLPDFQLVAGMTKYNEPTASPWVTVAPGVDTTYMVGATITIPLWGLFNERAVIAGAARDRAAANSNLQIALNQSRTNLRSTYETLQTTEFRLDNYEQHLMPLSEQALRIAMINYSSGKIDFQTLVDTATARRNIRHDYIASVLNYESTCSGFGQLLGEEL